MGFTFFSSFVPWNSTPTFNSHWSWIFDMLGWKQRFLHKFWVRFMNITNGSEHITFHSFVQYFEFDEADYGVKQCFDYFNTSRSGNIDFLEFMIGTCNLCPENIDTLIHFAFDMYDLDGDNELSLPVIEKIPIDKDIIHDMIEFTEGRGGVLDLQSFAFYSFEHLYMLLPIFNIQRKVQAKIFGTNYWKKIHGQTRSHRFWGNYSKSKTNIQPKEIQAQLRKYGAGGAASYAVEFQGIGFGGN